MYSSETSHSPATFVRAHLQRHPRATFEEVRRAAAEIGLTLLPIVYGRTKKALAYQSLPPQPSSSAGELSQVVAASAAIESETKRYRQVLEQIAGIVEEALAGG